MAITRAQLRSRAEAIADQPASSAAIPSTTIVSESQANDFVNDGIRHLYDVVIDAHPDFRVTYETAFTITNPATPTHALPTDFRSARGVLIDPGTQNEDWLDSYAQRAARIADRRSFRISGGLVWIEPRFYSVGTYQLAYNPTAPVLSADGSALDVELEQFQDVIVLHAAMMMLIKNKWDIAEVASLLGVAKQAALRWAKTQRNANPPRIEDVRSAPRMMLRR